MWYIIVKYFLFLKWIKKCERSIMANVQTAQRLGDINQAEELII